MNRGLRVCDLTTATGWTVFGNDTVNLAAAASYPYDGALEFDKADGAAGKVYAGASCVPNITILEEDCAPTDAVVFSLYVSASTDVLNAFVRLGVDSSNYIEWRVADSSLNAGAFTLVSENIGNGFVTGTGWGAAEDTTGGVGSVTKYTLGYAAVGVNFDAQDDTLADISFADFYIQRATTEVSL